MYNNVFKGNSDHKGTFLGTGTNTCFQQRPHSIPSTVEQPSRTNFVVTDRVKGSVLEALFSKYLLKAVASVGHKENLQTPLQSVKSALWNRCRPH